MRAFPILLMVFVAACGAVRDRAECSVSTDCPAGQYCARTPDGSVCWPDAVPPSVSGVTVSCPAPCLRDSVLHVQATVADDAEVLGAEVTLDVGGPAFAMTRAGGVSWEANVPLRDVPFEAFEADVAVTVTARDGARNATESAGAPVHVTRLRWTYDAGVPMSSPSVMPDGTAVVGLSKTALQILAVNADGTKRWEVTAGSGSVTAAPAIGDRAIWVGSEDFSVYAVTLDGSALLPNVGVNAFGQIRGGVAVRSGVSKEWAFAASGNGYVAVASTTANDHDISGPTGKFSSSPVLRLDERICAATETASATLRNFSFDAIATALAERWNVGVGVNVSAPLAIDSDGNLWSGSQDGKLMKTIPFDASGASTTVATFADAVRDSPIILSNGDVIVGDQSGVLHRVAPSGARVWAVEPNLGASVLAGMALTGGAARFVVPTEAGKVFALKDDGTTSWSKELAPTVLRAANIFTPSPQTGPMFSTAYFSGANGKLYAVIVDGALDAAAPWPKAFHDPRNTNRAGAQP